MRRLEYAAFYIWIGISAWLSITVAADHFFGSKATRKRTGLRFALVVLWPLAMLSRRGRDILFKEASEL